MLCELNNNDMIEEVSKRLNPCSNGRCSASISWVKLSEEDWSVLILVLMEDALRGYLFFLCGNTFQLS